MKRLLLFVAILLPVAILAQNNARMLSTPNTVTTTPYTFTAADTTRVVVFNSGSAIAASLPNGATFGFGAGTMLSVVNAGAGTATITCSSCTITYAGTASATLALSSGQGADIYGGYGSPAVNYVALPSPTGGGSSSLTGPGTISGTFAGNFTTTGNQTQQGNNTHTGTETFANINSVVVVDGVTYAHTDAGIQEAVNATPDGGTVFLPTGTYALTGTGAEEILITKKINFVCAGWGTVLQVGAAVPGTTDIIHVEPTSLVQGGEIRDCYITPAAGTPGRHGISIDGTNAALSNWRLLHNRIDALGGKSIAVINATGLTTGTPFTSTFEDNIAQGGWDFTNSGDSNNFLGNVMTGSGGFIWFPVGATVQPTSNGGAHGFVFERNNFTNTGGIWIQNGWQGAIAYNNIEVANIVNVSGNATCIDVDGNTAGNIENFKIVGNFIGCSNGASNVSQIRVNRANSSYIAANLGVRSVGVTYLVTANANGTQISDNRQSPVGEQITTWLSDSGTRTNVCYLDANTYDRVCTDFAIGVNGSVNRIFGTIGGTQVKVASNIPLGFSSGTDVASNGLDVGLSRLGAGSMALGNGTAGDATGSLTLGVLATAGITNSKGIQLFSTSTTCSTSGVIDNACTTGAITLPVAYADTNYRLSCTGQGPTALPIVQTYTKSNTTFTITIVALTAAVATFTSYDCLATHN